MADKVRLVSAKRLELNPNKSYLLILDPEKVPKQTAEHLWQALDQLNMKVVIAFLKDGGYEIIEQEKQ